MRYDRLKKLVQKQFTLDLYGAHGVYHWRRVAMIGTYLGKGIAVDHTVIKLFALLHDARRENEYTDSEHGVRAAAYVKELQRQEILSLSSEQLNLLTFAIEYHSDSDAQSDNLTVRTCWESDRLDLWRVDIIPRNEYLYTEKAKSQEAKDYSLQLYRDIPMRNLPTFTDPELGEIPMIVSGMLPEQREEIDKIIDDRIKEATGGW